MLKIRLNEILQERGSTQSWLAKKSGVNRMTIGKIVSGDTRVSLSTIEKIWLALEVPVEQLIVADNDQ